MIKIIQVNGIDRFVDKVLPKTSQKNKKTVQAILTDVQKNGDSAVKKYERKFTGASISSLRVTKNEIKQAYSKVTKKQILAIKTAKSRLVKTELSLKSKLKKTNLSVDGTKIERKFVPILNVGCYVPGGLARYPSSVVMSVIPAKVAGVKRIVVVTPPNQNGTIEPFTLVTCDICGVTEIYKTGGAQAIGALAFGTKSIKKVEKIVGPGGLFVSMAKALVSDLVSIDMIAGPTELGIIADGTADSNLIVNDLFSQAEHSVDTFCFVITNSMKLANNVQKLIKNRISQRERSNIINKSLSTNGFIAICRSQSDIVNLTNELAPEHLEIMAKYPKLMADKITSAGLILIGKNTPSAASDYLLGTNHILPTSRFARVRGSLSVLDFMKMKTQVESSRKSLIKISSLLKEFTKAEQLPNHYEAIRSRIN